MGENNRAFIRKSLEKASQEPGADELFLLVADKSCVHWVLPQVSLAAQIHILTMVLDRLWDLFAEKTREFKVDD